MFHRKVVIAAAVTVALGLLGSIDTQARNNNIGTVFEVKTGAFGTPPGGAQSPKRTDDGVVLNEFIETVPDGALRISLIDETTLSLGGGSKLVLDELVYDPTTRDGSSVIKFAAGTFFWATGQIASKERMVLDTPVASIGIRGTEFALTIGADGATQVAVVDGLVELRSKISSEIVSIPAGHNADVNSSGRVSPLRVGIPRTGDRNVDMVVAKAEEKAKQASSRAADRQAKATDKDARAAERADAKEERSGSTSRILPVKAAVLAGRAANENEGMRNSYKLDTSSKLTPIPLGSLSNKTPGDKTSRGTQRRIDKPTTSAGARVSSSITGAGGSTSTAGGRVSTTATGTRVFTSTGGALGGGVGNAGGNPGNSSGSQGKGNGKGKGG